MSQGQTYSLGEPQDLYIVTNGDAFKVYARLSSARALKTRNSNDRWQSRNGEWKILKVNVENAQEVE